jgi:hypothetical protein
MKSDSGGQRLLKVRSILEVPSYVDVSREGESAGTEGLQSVLSDSRS